MNQKIILASQSPRRKQLLEWAEIPFEIIVQPTDESFPANMPIPEVPIHIALNKAKAVAAILDDKQKQLPILAADTIVVLNERVINKPTDKNDAIQMLTALSGKQHKVITGVVLLHGDSLVSFADTTLVDFHPLTKEQIEFYVEQYKPYDKAGAYAIQEWIGVVGIKSVQGDFYNVMGLPVSRVVQELSTLKIIG